MNKIVLAGIISSLALVGMQAHAQKTEVNGTRAMLKAEIETRKQELKGMAPRKEIRATATSTVSVRLSERASVIGKRLDDSLSKLKVIADKIDSRLSKIEQTGKDVSALKTKLAQARILLSDTEAAISNFRKIQISGDLKSVVSSFKTTLKEAEKTIIDVRMVLLKITSEIKGVSSN